MVDLDCGAPERILFTLHTKNITVEKSVKKYCRETHTTRIHLIVSERGQRDESRRKSTVVAIEICCGYIQTLHYLMLQSYLKQ